MEEKYNRASYIHPLYALDGSILTEDFPGDHAHHRGIFWAWHQLYVGTTKMGDGWDIKNFKWELLSVKEVKNESQCKSIKATYYWKSPLWTNSNGIEKPLVKEQTTITVYPSEENYRKIDIEIRLLAMEENMRIGGSENEKGYGGFSARIKLKDSMIFSGTKGTVSPQNLPIAAGAWINISGALGKNETTAGISILNHPENPGYPSPWILRSKGSMQNAVYPSPGAKAVALSNVTPTVLRYRLLIHNGIKASVINIEQQKYK